MANPQGQRVMSNEDELSLFSTANKFYRASIIVNETKIKPSTSLPRYYLFAHSIELSYKSYLLRNGIVLEILIRKYGHNLLRALRQAKSYGFLDKSKNPNFHTQIIKK